MAIINLRKHYYPIYTKDTFVEVPDEVAEAMLETRRESWREDRKKHYYKVYSLDASEGLENHAMFLVLSPEDILVQAEDEAAHELLLEHLREAISHLSAIQQRRLHARYVLNKRYREIAEAEGVSGSVARDSVEAAIKKLKKQFAKNKWTRNPREE